MKIHFIAIGGSAMHQLALALHRQGHQVSGSDDEIYDPARKALQQAGLLPEKTGWNAEKLDHTIDMVILGMHAKADNPELLKAQELGLKVISFPEYIYQASEHKQRIVIAGSHGKTTVTAMIIHVLQYHRRKFDYMVGAKVPGFEYSLNISADAPVIVLEGDEYLASAICREPKFLLYKHHIGVVTGIAWDHVNVFPTEHQYVRQFDHFADATPKGGILVFNEEDDIASVICRKERDDVTPVEYSAHECEIHDGVTYLVHQGKKTKVNFFGHHNMLNVNAAKNVLLKIGITDEMFYEAIASFTGAANRLEIIAKNDQTIIFKDFAHAPSKISATIRAVKNQFPERKLLAVFELHTYSSLNREFLAQYADTTQLADQACVYINPAVVASKNLSNFSHDELKQAFNRNDLLYFDDLNNLERYLLSYPLANTNVLLMSSGAMGGLDLKIISEQLLKK